MNLTISFEKFMQKQLRNTINKIANQMSSDQASEYNKNPFEQPLIEIYQIWGGTLIMFEGGNLKAATTFLMGNLKKKIYMNDLHCEQI